MADQVNHPPHYQCGGIETIDVIRAKLGPGFGYYCEGNAIKYLTRWRLKGGVEDLRKARVYLDWLIESEAFDPYADQSNTPIATYEEQAVAHHAIDAPMPAHVAELLDRAESDDPQVGSLKAGEAEGAA